MKSPNEIYKSVRNLSIKKATLSVNQVLSLSVLAGIYISLGAIGSVAAGAYFEGGAGKFLGSLIFPIGLVLVIIAGAELFTGNCLMTIGWINKDISVKKLFINWTLVYLGNFMGSLLMVFAALSSGLFTGTFMEKIITIATVKVNLINTIGLNGLLVKGTLCNILVVLAVWIALSTDQFSGKILACWLPVTLFVFLSFEHSIANMFFLFAGKIAGADISFLEIFLNNLIPVTIGNIIGGAIIIPLFYHLAYSDKMNSTLKNKYNKVS